MTSNLLLESLACDAVYTSIVSRRYSVILLAGSYATLLMMIRLKLSPQPQASSMLWYLRVTSHFKVF